MNELWKEVPGHPLYEVSSFGNVRSYNHSSGRRRKFPRLLKPTKIRGGYFQVRITNSKHFMVHQLVGMTFLPNPENHPIILHLDNNPENNKPENLKWGTQKENISQCVREERRWKGTPNPKGNNQWKKTKQT